MPIVTFYSYKGGTGRTMALANIAVVLARSGLNVTIVDMDFESPGLEMYFNSLRTNIEEVRNDKGMVDILVNYYDEHKQRSEDRVVSPGESAYPSQTLTPSLKPSDVMRAIYELEGLDHGRLQFISPGQRDGDVYKQNWRKIDWEDFYNEREGAGYFAWLYQELCKTSDIVLVDSRTGVSGIGGISTVELADVIVMLCSTNLQHMEGAKRRLTTFQNLAENNRTPNSPLEILVVPSMIDTTNGTLLNNFKTKFLETFNYGVTEKLDVNPSFLWELMIPYRGIFSYDEMIAMLPSIETLATSEDFSAPYRKIAFSILKLCGLLPEHSIIAEKIKLNDGTETIDFQIANKALSVSKINNLFSDFIVETPMVYEEENNRRAQGILKSVALNMTKGDVGEVSIIQILNAAVDALRGTGGKIYVADKANHQLILLAAVGDCQGLLEVGDSISFDEGISGVIFRTNRAKRELNYKRSNFRVNRYIDKVKFDIIAGVPVRFEDEPIGVIAITRQSGEFSDVDISHLEGFASVAAMAIRNDVFFLFGQGYETLEAINNWAEFKRLLEKVLESVSYLVGFRRGAVCAVQQYRYEDSTGTKYQYYMELVAGFGVTSIEMERLLQNSEGEIANVLDNAIDYLLIDDMVLVPLVTQEGKRIGLLVLLEVEKMRSAAMLTNYSLEALAKYAGLSLERVKDSEKLRSLTLGARISQEILDRLREELEPARLVHAIAEQITKYLNCSRTVLFVPQVEPTADKEITVLSPLGEYSASRSSNNARSFKDNEGIVGKVFRSGETRLLANATIDLNYLPSLPDRSSLAPRSMIVVPIKVGARIVGILSADQYESFAYFTSDHKAFLEELSNHLGILIERSTILTSLKETSTRIIHLQDIVQTLYEIVKGGVRLSKVSLGVIYLLNRTDTGDLTLAERPVIYPAASKQPTQPRLDDPEGITSQIVASRELKKFVPITAGDRVKREVTDLGIRRMIGVPIIDQNVVVGVFYLRDKNTYDFTEMEEFSLRILADFAAIAIRSKRLSRMSKMLEAVSTTSSAVGRFGNITNMFDEIMRRAWEMGSRAKGSALFAHISLISVGKLKFVAAYPPDNLRRLREAIGDVDLVHGSEKHNGKFGITGLAAIEKRPILISNTDAEITEQYSTQIISYNNDTKSIVAVPILDFNNNVAGVIVLAHRDPYAFDTSDVDNINVLANLIANSLQQQSFLEDYNQVMSQYDKLLESSSTFSFFAEPNEILNGLTRIILDTTKAIWCQLILTGANNRPESIISHDHYRKHDIDTILWDEQFGVSWEVYERQLPAIIENVDIWNIENPTFINPIMLQENVKSAICLPISTHNQRIGVAWVHFASVRSFSKKEIDVLQLYIRFAVMSYDSAKLRKGIRSLI